MIDINNNSLFFLILQLLTPLFVGAVAIGTRIIINMIRSLREDLKEYVRRETCRAHRGSIEREIDELRHMLKFGRRVGDGALSELVKTFNDHLERADLEDAERADAVRSCGGSCHTNQGG